jgi:hypothetical protein
MRFPLITNLIVIVLALSVSPLAYGIDKSIKFNAVIAAGKSKAVRLRDASKGTEIDVEVTSSGELTLFTMDELNFSSYPDEYNYFLKTKITGKSEVTARLPSAGNYYLVFDNRSGREEKEISVVVTASLANFIPVNNEELKVAMNNIVNSLHKIFIFESMTIQPAICGSNNVYTQMDTIVLCLDYLQHLKSTTQNPENTKQMLLFALLHEIGHVLLKEWDYPFYDNEEIADEFATVMMVMTGKTGAAITQAKYFASISSEKEMNHKLDKDDTHPFSRQRARNILRWLQDPNHGKEWQTVLVPHMQTNFLKKLKDKPVTWSNPSLVGEELNNRFQ